MTSSRSALGFTIASSIAFGLLGFAGCRGDFVGGATSGGGDAAGGGSSSENGSGGGLLGLVCPVPGDSPPLGCEGIDSTIGEMSRGELGLDTTVTIEGVVAMSQKFLLSQSRATGSCLYGLFVSEQVEETAANTGMLVVSFGAPAFIPVGETRAVCAKIGQEPGCDAIPDDVKPGDVLTVTGTSQIFPNPPTNCSGDDPDNQVGMRQLSGTCYVERTGTATIPRPHVLTPEEVVRISSTTDAEFHNSWGAVKVRTENVGVIPSGDEVVGGFGIITLDNGIHVGNKIYYRPYSENKCHAQPDFPNTSIVFERVDGFHYLNFCTWGIEPNDKCGDYSPGSADCNQQLSCPPDILPGAQP